MASDDVLHGDLGEDTRMLLGPRAVYVNLVPTDLLTHLAQYRDDIHAGAARQRHQQQLHRRGAAILAALRRHDVERNRVPGAGGDVEAHRPHQYRARIVFICHSVPPPSCDAISSPPTMSDTPWRARVLVARSRRVLCSPGDEGRPHTAPSTAREAQAEHGNYRESGGPRQPTACPSQAIPPPTRHPLAR